MLVEEFSVYVMVKEVAQLWGSEYVFSLLSQETCPFQQVNQHFLGGYGSLVQLHLPIHQPAGGQIVLYGVDAF